MPVDPERLRAAFERACDLAGDARERLLAELGADDPELARAVEALLRRDAEERGPLRRSDAPASGGRPATEFVEGLSRHRPPQSRYRFVGELARGGMGAILKVWDEDLDRPLAMKVVLGRASSSATPEPPAESVGDPLRTEQVLARFLGEAQVTGQLDHPGIVPVHELGLDHDGRVYFTMRLVEGRELREVLELAARGAEGWSRSRALEVLIKVCDAVAYAHSRGVVHRDLKPSNVMVGRFGEVYVMDWGLARVLDADPDDPTAVRQGRARTLRSETGERGGGAAVSTQEGAVMGTPAYMPPEQARGERERVGPAADVYALGAMLYHLLTGGVPYRARSGPNGAHDVLERLLAGPPEPVAKQAPDAPAELVAICERAMAREPEDRFAGARALAEDLRAYLDLRVVRSYRTGWRPELAKWVARNRTAAASLAALLLVALAAALGGVWLQGEREAEQRESEALLLSLGLDAPLQRMDQLRIHPDGVPALEAWLAETRGLLAARPITLRRYAELRGAEAAGELPPELAEPLAARAVDLAELEEKEARTRELLADPATPAAEAAEGAHDLAVLAWSLPRRRASLEFERALAEWRRGAGRADPARAEELSRLGDALADLARLGDAEGGAIRRVEGWLAEARALRARSVEAAAAEWSAARSGVAAHPAYGGLDLPPQLGLVPLGPDPASGLWEFWHVLSGDRPERGPDGKLAPRFDSGIVLVLVPGGTAELGSGEADGLREYERGRVTVELEPFFLAKHELTQAQWERATGAVPAAHRVDFDYRSQARIGPRHPVEQVTWYQAEAVLRRWGLELPTEGRWEHAARAGGGARFGVEADFEPLRTTVQHYDVVDHPDGTRSAPSDGHFTHAPVDVVHANAWGLHGMLGNVSEWMREPFVERLADVEPRAGDGAFLTRGRALGRAERGGSYTTPPAFLGVGRRHRSDPGAATRDLGVRPARSIEPERSEP